jgi:hypothetical protein
MKICRTCSKSKPLSEFYTHPTTADRLFLDCKACHKSLVLSYRATNRDRLNVAARIARATETAKAKRRAYRASYKASHRHKDLARHAVNNGIRDGSLERKPCAECGAPDTEAHHEDYTKPLEVVWLCRKHHGLRHSRRIRPAMPAGLAR